MSRAIYDFEEKDRISTLLETQTQMLNAEDNKQNYNVALRYATIALIAIGAILITKKIMKNG